MQFTALLAGLSGAILSAGLSYWIRASLDKRALRISEAKLAYVHFVQISQIVATEIAITSFVKVYVSDEIRDSLTSKEGLFEPSHALSVIISNTIREASSEKLKSIEGLSAVSAALKSLMDELDASRLSAEQLSKLPRETINEYAFFQTNRTHLRGCLALWMGLAVGGDISWVTPQAIHDQWTTLVRFCTLARALRLALLKAGAASLSEASALLKRQLETTNQFTMARFNDKSALAAAAIEAARQSAEKAA